MRRLLNQVCDEMQIAMPSQQQIKEVYLPLAAKIASQHKGPHCLVLGINGPQGAGKSTLSRLLKLLLEKQHGKRVALLAIDDFYKTKSERAQLAKDLHPLFATRGAPGTNDVALAIELINRIKSLGENETLTVPRFDKTTDDRYGENQWGNITGPIDILIFEGWCLGVGPQAKAELLKPINLLEREEDVDGRWRTLTNTFLQDEYQALFKFIDYFILIKIDDFETVLENRLQQEKSLYQTTGSCGMTVGEIKRFVQFFQRLTEYSQKTLSTKADVVLYWRRGHRFIMD